MSKVVPMIGKRFGRLTVIAEGGKARNGQAMWICCCECGSVTSPVFGGNLRSGTTSSCGCLKREKAAERASVHGKTGTHIYKVWCCMKDRCFCTTNPAFENYGGRGITICSEWLNSFEAFCDYVSQLPHFGEKGYSLDRINNDGNYEPGNVRWATAKEQSNNRRKRRFYKKTETEVKE